MSERRQIGTTLFWTTSEPVVGATIQTIDGEATIVTREELKTPEGGWLFTVEHERLPVERIQGAR